MIFLIFLFFIFNYNINDIEKKTYYENYNDGFYTFRNQLNEI